MIDRFTDRQTDRQTSACRQAKRAVLFISSGQDAYAVVVGVVIFGSRSSSTYLLCSRCTYARHTACIFLFFRDERSAARWAVDVAVAVCFPCVAVGLWPVACGPYCT